jgi:dihydroxyacetone kinase DhaKLM complex PTS-EIIA-like component DhaM
METKVNIEVTKDEALVLFDFLSRLNEKETVDLFEDQAEQKVLWIIEGILEKNLVEPFKPDYKEIIQQARDRLRDNE